MKGGLKTFECELAAPILAIASFLVAVDCARAQSWTLQTNPPPITWRSVCCSSDGSKIAAVNGTLYVSTNSGKSWAISGNTNSPNWGFIACSADGTKFIAASNYSAIYTSTNSGASWQAPTNVVFMYTITSVASSADGNTLLTASSFLVAPGGAVISSTNAGLTWTTNLTSAGWGPVACSADGTILAAASYESSIFVSTNSGGAWATNNSPSEPWQAMALSADGSTLAAAGYNTSIYVTTNLGITWKTNDSPVKSWRAMAMSADGTKMVAAGGGFIYISTNSGVNWVSNSAPSLLWISVASSADGSKLVAVSEGGASAGIYTWQAIPSLNLAVTSGGCLLSWPCLSSTTNYALQQNGDLTTTNWAAVTNQPGVTNGQYQVMLPPQSGSQFYRLLQGQ
jgi:hypothetical protein